jgi:hypothetical protein
VAFGLSFVEKPLWMKNLFKKPAGDAVQAGEERLGEAGNAAGGVFTEAATIHANGLKEAGAILGLSGVVMVSIPSYVYWLIANRSR